MAAATLFCMGPGILAGVKDCLFPFSLVTHTDGGNVDSFYHQFQSERSNFTKFPVPSRSDPPCLKGQGSVTSHAGEDGFRAFPGSQGPNLRRKTICRYRSKIWMNN